MFDNCNSPPGVSLNCVEVMCAASYKIIYRSQQHLNDDHLFVCWLARNSWSIANSVNRPKVFFADVGLIVWCLGAVVATRSRSLDPRPFCFLCFPTSRQKRLDHWSDRRRPIGAYLTTKTHHAFLHLAWTSHRETRTRVWYAPGDALRGIFNYGVTTKSSKLTEQYLIFQKNYWEFVREMYERVCFCFVFLIKRILGSMRLIDWWSVLYSKHKHVKNDLTILVIPVYLYMRCVTNLPSYILGTFQRNDSAPDAIDTA